LGKKSKKSDEEWRSLLQEHVWGTPGAETCGEYRFEKDGSYSYVADMPYAEPAQEIFGVYRAHQGDWNIEDGVLFVYKKTRKNILNRPGRKRLMMGLQRLQVKCKAKILNNHY
jgi:hypothetical protein